MEDKILHLQYVRKLEVPGRVNPKTDGASPENSSLFE